MKFKLAILSLAFTLTLVACSKNNNDQQVNNSFNDSTNETSFAEKEENSSKASSLDEKFAEMEQEASEIAESAKTLDSGEVYDKIKNIHDDVKLTEMDDASLSITINVSYSTPVETINSLFDVVDSICNNCNLEDYYNSLIFNLKDTNGFLASLNLTSYSGPSNYVSTEPTLFNADENSDYKDALHDIYIERYSDTDIMSNFE